MIYYIMTIPYILYKTGPFETITHPQIVQCFQTNEKMLKSKIVYFNDRACKNFIKQYFGPNIVKAYNKLIPGAYKADLWRYCVLSQVLLSKLKDVEVEEEFLTKLASVLSDKVKSI